jgi:hypothetical protein
MDSQEYKTFFTQKFHDEDRSTVCNMFGETLDDGPHSKCSSILKEVCILAINAHYVRVNYTSVTTNSSNDNSGEIGIVTTVSVVGTVTAVGQRKQ